jgi:hypothetical protein
MEGFRQQDEFNALRSRLPPLDQRLRLKVPLEAKLRELNPAELDLIQEVVSAPSLEAAFDTAKGTDLDAAKSIVSLVQRGYLESVE